ncbi:MAG: hypothetical protein RMJ05_12935, partial [Thermomicrobium sp.]|nr:hypothetical protein [Thermomicrobium sp.]MDW8007602.1 hypothetical protein [Thermomicrobium sp.]
CIAGSAELRADATRPVPLALGRTALVPATVTTLHVTGAATLLVASIPDRSDSTAELPRIDGAHPPKIEPSSR